MAALAGDNAKVVIGSAEPVLLNNWEVTPGAKDLDTTSFGDGWETNIMGLKNWTAKVMGHFDYSDTTGQKALVDAFIAGTSVTLKLYTDSTKYCSGSAFVTSLPIKAPVDGLVDVEIDFKGSGQLDFSTLF